MINKNDERLFNDLVAEDNAGLVLRGHLHVEHELIKYISKQLPFPDRIDWGRIDYTGKVELALSCGLEVNIRPGLVHLGTLRNNFVSRFSSDIDPQWVLVAYNGLPEGIKHNVENAYKLLGKKITHGSSTLDTRDLLILIFICLANDIHTSTTGRGGKQPGAVNKKTVARKSKTNKHR